MRLFTLLTILAASTTLMSCNQQVKEERIRRIDSLGIHLNYVAESINKLDSQMLVNRLNDIDQTSLWVYDNITDTLDRVPGLIFGDFLRSKKYLGQAITRYNEVNKELKYSEKQLETFRNDVRNDFFSDEEFKGYYNTESLSIERLVSASDELMSKYESSNDKYSALKPKITHVVDSIKAVIYAPTPAGR